MRRTAWEFQSDRVVIGTDEVGVGPLAGPIFAAAVVVKPGTDFPLVNDSKRLTATQRHRALESMLKAGLLAWSCRSTTNLDPSVTRARLRLMSDCVSSVQSMIGAVSPLVVVDGNLQLPLPPSTEQVVLVKGDTRCLEVACASIIAKVLHDEYMFRLAREFPEYGFERHNGYGTEEHVEAIIKHGKTAHHRDKATATAIATYLAKREAA